LTSIEMLKIKGNYQNYLLFLVFTQKNEMMLLHSNCSAAFFIFNLYYSIKYQ